MKSTELIGLYSGDRVIPNAVVVAERLRVDQNFYDQEPLNWLMLDPAVPAYYFKEDRDGLPPLLRALTDEEFRLSVGTPNMKRIISDRNWVKTQWKSYLDAVNPEYAGDYDKVLFFVIRVIETLGQYPYIWEYLNRYIGALNIGGSQYSVDGSPSVNKYNRFTPGEAYPHHAFTRAQGKRAARMTGLSSVLPDGQAGEFDRNRVEQQYYVLRVK